VLKVVSLDSLSGSCPFGCCWGARLECSGPLVLFVGTPAPLRVWDGIFLAQPGEASWTSSGPHILSLLQGPSLS